MASRKAIITAIGTLQALGVQGGPNRSDEGAMRLVVEVWAKVLAPIDDSQLEAAVLAWVAQPSDAGRFWPTPGNLLALEPSRQLAAVDDSAEAWAHVVELARHGKLYSRYGGTLASLSPAVEAGVEACGGREAIATSPYDAHVWMQAAFRRAYTSAKATGAIREQHPQLTDGEAQGFLRLVDGRTGRAS